VQGAHVGAYEVTDLLGSGGYGDVYQVREPAPLSRMQALKVLRIDQFNEKAFWSFFDEARHISNLQHPNILPVYNFGQLEDGRPYFVMEYAPRTINDFFCRDGGDRRPASVEELEPYVHQAAEALQYVHKNGLIHLDVKPGNLLIGRYEQLLLSDFGIAFYLGMQAHASRGEVTGSAAYMPPEQWQGNPQRNSDQYALAICCYELLTGRPPFQGNRIALEYQHIYTPPPPPSTFNPRLSAEIDMVLLYGLAKEPNKRFASISAFALAFQQATQGIKERSRTWQSADAPTIVSTKNVPTIASTRNAPDTLDIWATLAISSADALHGTSRTLTLPDGRQVIVSVPAGTCYGQIINQKGQGRPSRSGDLVGDLILTIVIVSTEESVSPLSTDDGETTMR